MIPAHHYWVDRLNPWLVHFGNGFGVRPYGLAYLAGFLLAGWILARWARRGKLPIPEEEVASFILYAALGVMMGGLALHNHINQVSKDLQKNHEVPR
ncbi:MAG: prolipoprotein diacylglyceryl transferase family protein [Acidobacteriaceae bacterium]